MERAPRAQQQGHHHGSHPRPHQTHTPNTFRLWATNLPARFAHDAPRSSATLVQVLNDQTGVLTYNACTYKRWLRMDGSHAYGFVEVHDEAAGTATFFAVNRHPTDALPLDLSLLGFGRVEVIDHQVMTHTALRAVNSLHDQAQVVPRKGTGARVDGSTLSASLPPHSWQMIRVKFG